MAISTKITLLISQLDNRNTNTQQTFGKFISNRTSIDGGVDDHLADSQLSRGRHSLQKTTPAAAKATTTATATAEAKKKTP